MVAVEGGGGDLGWVARKTLTPTLSHRAREEEEEVEAKAGANWRDMREI